MKVYAAPAEVPYSEPDYRNYDRQKEDAREATYNDALATWLKGNGYPGKWTGEIFSTPMADGCAQYMMADGAKSCLIHLPHGDAWDQPMVRHMPKKAVITEIQRRKAMIKLFSNHKG